MSPPPLLAPSPQPQAPHLQGLRVLVVDDQADTRELLAVVLEEYGVIVQTVASSASALEALKNFKFDLLLSDIGMPDEDGYTLIRNVRALEAQTGEKIPSVALRCLCWGGASQTSFVSRLSTTPTQAN